MIQKINFNKLPNVNRKQFVKKSVKESDEVNLITKASEIYLDGEKAMLYIPAIIESPEFWGNELRKIKFSKRQRIGGMVENAAYMGSYPNFGYHSRHCNLSALNFNNPHFYEKVVQVAQEISEVYSKEFPEIFNHHLDLVNHGDAKRIKTGIKGEYLIENTPFTAVVMNKNSPMLYHVDGGNHKNALTALLAFKKNCVGGHICFPEYGFSIELTDGSLFLFNGEDIVHGVSPFQLVSSSNSYRYSMVFYSKVAMWKCKSLEEELHQAQINEFNKNSR